MERDEVKRKLCEAHGINILYFSHAHINYPYPVFESFRLLLEAIKRRGIIITDRSQWCDPELALEEKQKLRMKKYSAIIDEFYKYII